MGVIPEFRESKKAIPCHLHYYGQMSQPLLQSIDLKTRLFFGLVLLAYLATPVLLNPSLQSAELEESAITLTAAEALPMDIGWSELAAYEDQWRPITLPLHWREQFTDSRAVWYRIELPDLGSSVSDTDSLGIYLWRVNQTAEFWLNGTQIGSGGRTEEPMARYWNTPLYFPIPETLLAGNDELLVKHYAEQGWGSMEALVLGPEAVLLPLYERRYFIQHDVALGLFVFVLVTGGLSLMIWIYRRRETEYLWFSIASVALAVYCLNQFIRYLPMSAELWRWLINISIDIWAVTTVVFVARSLKLDIARMERVLFAYLSLGVILYLYASYSGVYDINIYFHIGSILLGAYCFYYCAQAWRRTRELLPVFYCFVIVLVTIAGIHDVLMQAALNNGWQFNLLPAFNNHFNFTHFAAPLIFVLIAVNLMKRFVLSMNAADETNEQLEERVRLARKELDDNYKAMEAVLKAQSAQDERERIYRDLHDDVGSKLLSLYYRLDKEGDSLLAKSALEDLRDIVSHKSIEGCSLSTAAQQWRSEAEDRISEAGVALSWQCDSDLGEIELSEMQRTQLRRMLREVISNALLHGKQLSEIRIAIKLTGEKLQFDIDNNGITKPVADWKVGRGISNLRVRARNLSGDFSIVDLTGDWVRISWIIPLVAKS